MLMDSSAWIGIKRDGGSWKVAMENDLTMGAHWKTVGTGTEVASVPIHGRKVWLRAAADVSPGSDRKATFFYSTDGKTFHPLGEPFVLNNDWKFLMGYRYGIFNYATKMTGGAVTVSSFSLESP